MATIISSLLFAKEDINGNPFTDGYLLVEYRDAGYTPGGENLNLTSYFRRVEHIETFPASGALEYQPRVNYADLPGNAGSGRLQLWYSGSGVLNISGIAITILSGHPFLISGFIGPVSGRIAAQAAINAGVAPIEILSGTAVSGVRTKIYVLGY